MTTTRRNRLLVTAAPLLVLALLLFIPGNAAVGSAYNAGTAKAAGTILFARRSHWYTISANGTHLHMLLSSTAGCSGSGCAVFSPDGIRIMVAGESANKKRVTTAIINTDGSGYHVLPLPDARLNLGPGAWAPGGTRLALSGWAWDNTGKARAGIYMVNVSNGKGLVRLTESPDGRHDDPLAYSPDGSRLLFFHEGLDSGGPLFGDLLETTATGSGRIRLNPRGTSVPGEWGSPASWSPDGKQLAFTAFSAPASSGQSAVFVANADGTHRQRITSWGEWSTSAHWSPNGGWIVFDKVQAVARGNHSLFLVHPNGTGLRAITSAERVAVCCAVWSPDGSKLLSSLGSQGGELVTMNGDGTHLARLTRGDASGNSAEYAWGR